MEYCTKVHYTRLKARVHLEPYTGNSSRLQVKTCLDYLQDFRSWKMLSTKCSISMTLLCSTGVQCSLRTVVELDSAGSCEISVDICCIISIIVCAISKMYVWTGAVDAQYCITSWSSWLRSMSPGRAAFTLVLYWHWGIRWVVVILM